MNAPFVAEFVNDLCPLVIKHFVRSFLDPEHCCGIDDETGNVQTVRN